MKWLRDHSLSLTLFALFLASWVGQAVFQVGIEGESWTAFAASTLENWQSECAQLMLQVVLPVYLIHRNSPVSRSESDRLEAKIDRIERSVQWLADERLAANQAKRGIE